MFRLVTLLREIQEAATGTDIPLSVLLRKCAVLAHRLNNDPMANWVERELNGYPKDTRDELPPYRAAKAAEVVGDFVGTFGSQMKNGRIPMHVVKEEDRDFLFHVYFAQPVAELERLAESASVTIHSPWPQDFVTIYGDQVYEGMVAMTVTRVLPTVTVAGMLDTIRNRVLALVLEMEREAPDEDVGESLSADKVTQIFHTNVYGGQVNVAAAGRDVNQSTQQILDTPLEADARRLWAARHPWLTGLIVGVPGIAAGFLIWYLSK